MPGGVLLLGGGGHCRSVIDVLECAGVSIAGVVHGPDCSFDAVMGYPALGRDEDLESLRERFSEALITVGQVKSPAVRKHLFAQLEKWRFTSPMLASPHAYAAPSARIGAGTVIMHHAMVNAHAVVGKNCIINTKALVEHDCAIADHCHIAVGAVLCGGVTVGEGSFVATGALIQPMVSIGKGCVVSMGAKVFKNVEDGEIVR